MDWVMYAHSTSISAENVSSEGGLCGEESCRADSLGWWRTRRTRRGREGCNRHDAPEKATTLRSPCSPLRTMRSGGVQDVDGPGAVFCIRDEGCPPSIEATSSKSPSLSSISSAPFLFTLIVRISSVRKFRRRQPCSTTRSAGGVGTVM